MLPHFLLTSSIYPSPFVFGQFGESLIKRIKSIWLLDLLVAQASAKTHLNTAYTFHKYFKLKLCTDRNSPVGLKELSLSISTRHKWICLSKCALLFVLNLAKKPVKHSRL